jgi:hypothetical protein
MTSTEPRTSEAIQTEIDLVNDLRTATAGAEKGKLTRRLTALAAELATVKPPKSKLGKYDALDQLILAAIEGGAKDAKAVVEQMGDAAEGEPIKWRLMLMTKRSVLPAGVYWTPRSAKQAVEVIEAPPTATAAQGDSQVVEAS